MHERGEAEVDAVGGGVDTAEEVSGLPDLDAEVVGGEDRATDVAGRDRSRSASRPFAFAPGVRR